MAAKKDKTELLLEAHRINYKLRSTFFYRKLIEYHTYEFPETINRLVPISKEYSWDKKNQWGIGEDAFNQIESSDLNLIQVFAHPRILREHPLLTAYYRNVAALSQKSVSYLVKINTNQFEFGNKEAMNETQALALVTLFNQHITLVIENALQGFAEKHVKGLLFASTGAQIDGSWRNAIGEESERVVYKMLIKGAIDRSLLSAFLLRGNSGAVEKFEIKNAKVIMGKVDEYRGFLLNNKKSILFSSEPDVSLLDEDGTTLAVIEIKGGTDPAGALERYGAAKKSFEASIKDNSKVITILVANCITPEVNDRLKQDKTIKTYLNLAALVNSEDERQQFLKYVFENLMG